VADSPPGSGIPLLGPILDLLSNVLSNADRVQDLANSVNQVEQNAWTNLVGLSSWAYGLFGGVLGALGSLIKGIGSLLEHVIKDIIFGHIKALLEAIWKQLTDKHSWLRKMIATLQTLQKQYNAMMNQTLRKYIDLVQRIRKVLLPFRLLHIGFAQRLDAKLLGFEGRLGQMWASILAHQNLVGQILNDIIDPRGLLRPGSILGSFGIMVGAIHDAIGAFAPGSLLCLLEGGQFAPEQITWAAYQPQLIAYVSGNDPARRDDQSTAAQLLASMDRDLGTS
jgi:hypothetical protein